MLRRQKHVRSQSTAPIACTLFKVALAARVIVWQLRGKNCLTALRCLSEPFVRAAPQQSEICVKFSVFHRFWREILVKFSAAHPNPGKRSSENFTKISRQISRHVWQRKTEKIFTSALLQGSCSDIWARFPLRSHQFPLQALGSLHRLSVPLTGPLLIL